MKKVQKGLFWFGVFVCIISVRVFWSSYSEYEMAKKYETQGEYLKSVEAFGNAIRWYLPFNPLTSKSIAKLKKLGFAQANSEQAVFAFAEIRHALASTKSFYQPFSSELHEASRKVAELRSLIEIKRSPQKSPQEVNAYYQEKYEIKKSSFRTYVIFMQIFFWSWLACLFGFIWKGFSSSGEFYKRKAIPYLLASFFFFGMWLWSLTRIE